MSNVTDNPLDLTLVRHWFDSVDAKEGIGTELYQAISQLVPSVSVELFIRSTDRKSTLLIWRADEYYGPGWHVPGGVVRFKERLQQRVQKVVQDELNCDIAKMIGPIGFHEMFNEERDIRGHFVSFVFEVTLAHQPNSRQHASDKPSNGTWRWFDRCPDDLIPNQNQLRAYF